MNIADFAGKRPKFLPEDYLVGELEGWGIIESVVGSLKKRFTVQAKGSWDAVWGGISFTETWTFDDGFKDTLHWQIKKVTSGRYTGKERLAEGEAVGEQAGFAFHWTYTRDTPQPGGSSVKLNFNDWFFLIDEKVCIVRGSAGRAGVPFAIAHLTYRKKKLINKKKS